MRKRTDRSYKAVRRQDLGLPISGTSCVSGTAFRMTCRQCLATWGRESCHGRVHAGTDSQGAENSWFYPCCGDRGRIYNWQGSPWDQRAPHCAPTACSMGGSAGFWSRATAAWNAIWPEIRAPLLNNFWGGTCRTTASVDLRSGAVFRGNLVLPGYCTRRGSRKRRACREGRANAGDRHGVRR